jgi:plastocyanin domain-containing protein
LPVVVEFTSQGGEIAFTCGINMLEGRVMVQRRVPPSER